ncbi:HopJ type III effector protein [Sphingobacterium tabacisoli]|uniref:HopJ type III effector protein n=1 Tax=Sphingobacterium tabacisoli TaxID=2044855 RepID=A0ABW5L3S8_9SPHI|nr:HopJ type III effector protein [Sphingobacterium tabacisoli]
MKELELRKLLETEVIQFSAVLDLIQREYNYIPTAFKNGDIANSKDENQGSARVLFLGALHGLSKEQTLHLFGEHYRSVLNSPMGTDHQNIRQFIAYGWSAVFFEGDALLEK